MNMPAVNLHNFQTGAAFNGRVMQPLTIEQVRAAAPSAFAIEKHESRSERYTYIPTVEVIHGLMREGFQPFKATQSRSRIPGKTDFTKHCLRFRHVDQIRAMKVGDTVPEIVLINSHDGTSAYQLSEGLFRLICSNGLMVPDSIVQSIKIPHKGNVIQEVVEASFQIIGQTDKVLGKVDEFRQLQLTDGEQDAFAAAAHELRFADGEGQVHTPITPRQLLTPARREDMDPNSTNWARPAHTMWGTLNTVQEKVIKGGLHGTAVVTDKDGRRSPRRVTTREVKSIDMDVRLNRALFTLAERMAELKTVAA